MKTAQKLTQLHDATKEVAHLTATMTDKQLSRALLITDKLGLHLHFEAYIRIREAERNNIDPFPFPVPSRD